MPVIIRPLGSESGLNDEELCGDSWDLTAQVIALHDWLRAGPDLFQKRGGGTEGWIADIGFSPRQDATGGGPILTSELMQMCLDNRVQIHLSEYAPLEKPENKPLQDLTLPERASLLQALKAARAKQDTTDSTAEASDE